VGPLVELLNYLLLPLIVWEGIRIVRENTIKTIITVPWDEYFVAAYFIHLFTGSELFIYVMDDPLGNPSSTPLAHPLYSLLMGKILRTAQRVWAISLPMCESLEQRFGVKCTPKLPFLDVDEFVRECRGHSRQPDRELRLLYAGAIYSAHLDALHDLVQVVNRGTIGGGRSAVLTLFTPLSGLALRKMGIEGPNIARSFIPASEMAAALRSADVLFLPLSFQPEMRHLVETSLPTKLAEYLASGVPILVYAPPYASVSRYCRAEEFGLLVDEPGEEKLVEAIRRLATDTELRDRLASNALATALRHHQAQTARADFHRSLQDGSSEASPVESAASVPQ
jgi:glycosyltransferase involved in cell wall biosynthesis